MYEINVNYYNHVSGYDGYTYETRYTNINTAKRKLLDLISEDDNLLEDDAICEIAKDLTWARTEGRKDWAEYTLEKIDKIDICKDKSEKITAKELNNYIDDMTEYGVEITVE